MHIFWKCKVVRIIWLILFPKLINVFSSPCRDKWSFKEFWEGGLIDLSREEASKAGHFIWAIWQTKNQIKHSNCRKDSNQIYKDIMSIMDSFQIQATYQSKKA